MKTTLAYNIIDNCVEKDAGEIALTRTVLINERKTIFERQNGLSFLGHHLHVTIYICMLHKIKIIDNLIRKNLT